MIPRRTLLALAALILGASVANAQEPASRRPWDSSTVDLFRSLPVQEGGRVKPIDTLAGFKLLKLNGQRSVTTPEGETLTPVRWLLDCLFFPELAVGYQSLLVQNAEVIDAIGLPHDAKRKRDRYSFLELQPGFEKLRELAMRHGQKEEKDRSAVEEQIVQLWGNVVELGQLLHALDFARAELAFEGTPRLARAFPDPKERHVSVLLASSKAVLDAFQQAESAGDHAEGQAIQRVLDGVRDLGTRANVLALFPPSAPAREQREWLALGDLLEARFMRGAALDEQVRLVDLIAQLVRARSDPETFRARLEAFHDGAVALAAARGEYATVPLEVAFYKGDFFYRALLLYVLAFVLTALSWIWPRRTLVRASLASLVLATALVLVGIVLRCVIRGRPPVSTLYETILFVTGMAVLACMAIELLDRGRIAAAVATVIGTAGMFLATKYEFREGVASGDTMPSLIAVLDTNFWLSTHVTTVTMGYSAGLLAAAIAHVYVLGKILGFRRADAAFYANLSRMVYGVLCFGLLFSTVGTILGGIWANQSWGRFWGWDPKENGALMICLWELAILHARLGGYVRDFGVALLALVGGSVVAFSWWGVNLLGVGLHSYGFTTGAAEILWAFYALEAVIVILALGWRFAIARAPARPA
jgi:ABC-type transport system involved in cytochrome c biogenesis permease subunit